MSEFDAELYLRLVGERMLLERTPRHHGPWGSPLVLAAQALVAIDAISEPAADQVLTDYDLASALRSGEPGLAHHATIRGPRQASTPTVALDPARIVPCFRDVPHATGTIHVRYVSLRDDATSVAVSFRPAARVGRASRGIAGPMMIGGMGGIGPPQVTLTDDRGATANAHFEGGGSDEEWRGHLHAGQPLAPDTAWIEIDGQRVELADHANQVDEEVAVEPLPERNPALRHLWRLATPDHFYGHRADAIAPAADALIAAGGLSRDDPAIDDAGAVLEATAHGGMGHGGATRRLREPWRSMLARQGRTDGPTGVVMIGAATPVFDEVSVLAMALESTDSGWAVEVELAPDVVGHGPFDDGSARRRQLAWWALDDRGNQYLGQMGSWSADEERGSGEITFWPALDPKAVRLSLMPTGETQRAVISLPLCWHHAGDDAR